MNAPYSSPPTEGHPFRPGYCAAAFLLNVLFLGGAPGTEEDAPVVSWLGLEAAVTPTVQHRPEAFTAAGFAPQTGLVRPALMAHPDCNEPAFSLQSACIQHARNMRRTCNELTSNLQRTCKEPALNQQRRRNQMTLRRRPIPRTEPRRGPKSHKRHESEAQAQTGFPFAGALEWR